jgi:glycosyltransferase involved in cell wall biosynthesis
MNIPVQMKIIAVVDNDISTGGGFNQSLNAIMQMQRLCAGRFGFEVFTPEVNNVSFLKKFDVEVSVLNYSVKERLMQKLNRKGLWKIKPGSKKPLEPFEKKLQEHGCDLVYFVTPNNASSLLQELNYIYTLWDLCHRDNPEFPEVRNDNTVMNRDRQYRNNLGQAYFVLTDSDQLSQRASYRYGIDLDRFLAMPYAPSPFIAREDALSKEKILKKYNLMEGFFYYPAQFWAHKNHIRILEALELLRIKGCLPNVVFSGNDFGNRTYLETYTSQHSLLEQVRYLGFVPPEDVRGLYENSIAVVMPTYFGPTNLPPLEAWSLDKPLIYSSYFTEQAGDAALYSNPDNAQELADVMLKCNDPLERHALIEAGKRRLTFIANQRAEAEKELVKRLYQFQERRRCWQ